MLNYCKLTTKYFMFFNVLIVIVICLCFIIRIIPDSIFLKQTKTNSPEKSKYLEKNKINFLTKYPELDQEKCIKTGKLFGGDSKRNL